MRKRLIFSGLLAGLLLLIACGASDPQPERAEVEVEGERVALPPPTAVTRSDPPATTQPPPTAAPTVTPPQSLAAQLPDLGAAPEIGNELWINSETPLRLADLQGKVVLIEFWTYG